MWKEQKNRELDEDTKWMSQANCKGKTELFYNPVNQRPQARIRKEAEARALCESCAVVMECRSFARRNQEYGTWGNETEDERFAAGFLSDIVLRRRARVAATRADERNQRLLEQL